MGEGLAQILTQYVPSIHVTAKVTDASIENVNLVAEHAVSLALVQNDISFQAVRGEKPFKEPVENLRMVARLYPEQLHCVVTRFSGIKTLSDLKGKRVSVGASASGFPHIKALLSAAGLKYSDINADFLDFAHTAERLQNGRLDAGFLIAGYPAAAVRALTALEDIDLLTFQEDLLNELVEDYPFFAKDVIPAGTYPGVDHDTSTLAVSALLVCDAELSDDLVYGITQALFENLDELRSVHEKGQSISLDKALEGMVIPLHPGAARYYSEKKLAIPIP
jgi:TRAP transporter TAXI family solute receptor